MWRKEGGEEVGSECEDEKGGGRSDRGVGVGGPKRRGEERVGEGGGGGMMG